MVEYFSPRIHTVNGTITPKGYEWILGFALGGCQWAINKANEPEFKEYVRQCLKLQAVDDTRRIIKAREKDIDRLLQDIEQLSKDMNG